MPVRRAVDGHGHRAGRCGTMIVMFTLPSADQIHAFWAALRGAARQIDRVLDEVVGLEAGLDLNRYLVLDAIERGPGGTSQIWVAERLVLSTSAVHRHVSAAVAEGLVTVEPGGVNGSQRLTITDDGRAVVSRGQYAVERQHRRALPMMDASRVRTSTEVLFEVQRTLVL